MKHSWLLNNPYNPWQKSRKRVARHSREGGNPVFFQCVARIPGFPPSLELLVLSWVIEKLQTFGLSVGSISAVRRWPIAPSMFQVTAGISLQEVGRMAKIPHDGDKTETGDVIAEVRYIPTEPAPPFPEEKARPDIQDIIVDCKTFKIRRANTDEGRNSANMLINRMYSWRGYATSHQTPESPNLITLMATENHSVIGTISISFDSPIGILADETYEDEINNFRRRGGKICEFTKLAFDPGVRSKLALASLFHVAFIYAWHIRNCTDLFIEVNPRHRRFYERMLGFKRHGQIKNNPRVNAPAVLLWIDPGYAEHQILKFGGSNNHLGSEKSLYPYFFSHREEEGIAHRLLNLDRDGHKIV